MGGLLDRPKPIAKQHGRLHWSGLRWRSLAAGLAAVALAAYLCSVGGRLLPVPIDAEAPLGVLSAAGIGSALFGVLTTGRAVRGILHRRWMRARRRHRPDRPWLFDYPWDPKGIGDGSAGRAATEAVGLVAIWCLLASFVWIGQVIPDRSLGNVVVVATSCVGLLFTGIVLRSLSRFARHGRSRILFGSFPFSPGGKLAVAFLPARFQELTVTLRYVEERFEVEDSGDERTFVHAAYLHHEERRVVPVPAGAHAAPIEFQLPANEEWVTRMTADPGVRYWELVVEAADPGIRFSTEFPLPVYRRPTVAGAVGS